MKKWIRLLLGVALCLLLCGCSALLERSYSSLEPYTNRYWDSSAQDTLRAENYQDLVNSLLMLIEQRAEEAVIRCYDEVSSYQEVAKSRREVCRETMQGSYLLRNIEFSFEKGSSYSTAAFRMIYREDAEDLSGVMTLSDSQSLVDLLRLAVREEHEKITACFTYDTPREAVTAAVESYWQELCQDEMDREAAAAGADADVPAAPPEEDGAPAPEDREEKPEEAPGPEGAGSASEAPDEGDGEPDHDLLDAEEVSGETDLEPVVYPPCPWIVRFYPDRETAELVEILLKKT